jgi:hypothetical protein
MHMPYKSTLSTPLAYSLLPTPHLLFLYLSIYLFHLGWLVSFFSFSIFFFKNFYYLFFCCGGVLEVGRVFALVLLMWPMPFAQVWTHYKVEKLNMWTLFCNVCIDFLNGQIWKEIMLELNGKPSSVSMFSTDFSFQNLVSLNLFELSVIKIT